VGLEENMAVVRRQFELLSAGDTPGAAALRANQSSNDGRKKDRAGISRVFESLRSVRETHLLHEFVAEGDWVAVRTTCSGVYLATSKIPVKRGIFGCLPPTWRA
jgi:hypothetical protein